jgi:hypothetical protein
MDAGDDREVAGQVGTLSLTALARTATAAAALLSLLAWVAVQVPTFRHATGERREQLPAGLRKCPAARSG